MAYQLKEKFTHSLPQIWTSPVIPGTVQCTPDGSLIILMRDSQITGGYPRLLQLTESSIQLISQKTTNSKIQFKILPKIIWFITENKNYTWKNINKWTLKVFK